MKRTTIAFIAHPLSVDMHYVMNGQPKFVTKFYDRKFTKEKLVDEKPFVFLRLNNLLSKTGQAVNFLAVSCPLLPDQMASLGEDIVLQKITEAIRLAENNGAQLVSLGGFTSVVGNEGEKVAQRVRCAVTSGNTFTAMLAIKGVLKAADLVGLELRSSRVAIIGATGDIGRACAQYLAKHCGSLAISARNESRLDEFASQLTIDNGIQVNVYKKTADAVRNSDIIVSATSALTTIIDAADLKGGAIVCDVALPANIAREVSRQRNDILVFEGGLAAVPFYRQINNMRWNALMPPNGIYGCVSEAFLLGFEERFENFSIGRGNITAEKLHEIWQISQKHGFSLSRFFCGDHFYSDEYLRNLMKLQHERGAYVRQ